jgi:hypothetical protein
MLLFTWLTIGPTIIGWNTVFNELLDFIEGGGEVDLRTNKYRLASKDLVIIINFGINGRIKITIE